MHEATTIPTLTSDTSENLTAAARRAESWFGEPFLAPDEDPLQALAPGTARRAALDDALAEMDAGPEDAVVALEGALRAHARARARAHGGPAAHRGRDRASPPPDRRAHRDARRAHRVDATRRPTRTATETARRRTARRGRRGRARRGGRRRLRRRLRRRRGARGRSSREPTPARSAASASATRRPPGKTIAAAGFVEAARHLGILILTHRRLLVAQFKGDLTTEGYGDRFTDAIVAGATPPTRQPAHDPDVRLVRASRLRARPQRRTTSSSATRRTRLSARRRAPRSARSPSRSTSG